MFFKTKNENSYTTANRSNSSLEVMRLVLLFLLLFIHWQRVTANSTAFVNDWGQVKASYYQWTDTRILHYIGTFSVVSFAVLTGTFVYDLKKNLFLRNLSRLLFIYIIYWVFIMHFQHVSPTIGKWKWSDIYNIGGLWYLFAILPVYLLAPLINKFILRKIPNIYIFAFSVFLYLIARYLPSISQVTIFALSLLGYSLSRIHRENFKKSYTYIKITFALMLFTGFAIKILSVTVWQEWLFNSKLSNGIVQYDFQHDVYTWPTALMNVFIAVGLIGLLKDLKWHSQKVNWFVKRCYFVYEFHFAWQLLYRALFYQWSIDHQHLWLYLSLPLVYVTGIIASFIISLIQFKIWIPIVDNNIEPWFNNKIKPWCINKMKPKFPKLFRE